MSSSASTQKTPGQMFALVFGIVYIAVGLLGFAFLGSTPETREILNVLGIDILHNVAHLAIGGLLLFGSKDGATARMANLVVGTAYLLLAIIGFAGILEQGDILNLNLADNFLHISTAVLALYFGTVGATAPTLNT